MKLLIFGATGPTGLEIAKKALAEGHEVNIMARSPEKLGDELAQKVTIFKGELTEESTILASMEGVEAVISALGPSMTNHPNNLPITNGYRLIMKCMRQKGIRRLIALSTPSVIDEQNDRWSWWTKLAPYTAKLFLNNAYHDIIASGELIREQSDLDWTLYRVGSLQNSNQESGKLKASYAGEAGICIYRKDIAKFCLDELIQNQWIHKLPILSSS